MPKAKKILVTTATREVTVYRTGSDQPPAGLCTTCGSETDLLDLNFAADLSGRGALSLIDAIRSGRIHAAEGANGHLMICRTSLEESTKD